SKEGLEKSIESQIVEPATTYESQRVDGWAHEYGSKTSISEKFAKAIGCVIPITARVKRFEVRRRADKKTVLLQHPMDFFDQHLRMPHVLEHLPGVDDVDSLVRQPNLNSIVCKN